MRLDVAGHRSRLKQRFLAADVDGLCDHELLELLLFYAIPQKDVKPLAKELLNTFGSLENVFAADAEALCAVNGIGENSATLIKLAAALFRRIRTQKSSGGVKLDSVKKVHEYLCAHEPGLTDEKLFILLLNRDFRLIQIMEFPGAKGFLSASRRDIFFKIMCCPDAKRLVIVHNHPSGMASPSGSDVNNTIRIKTLFQEFGILLLDHLIIAGGKCFSMLKTPWNRCS